MFRDPSVYDVLRSAVIPWLRTYPFFRIWHAGCASGEEVYSMAILLKEAGLYDRATIFATDFNDHALSAASRGVYDVRHVEEYSSNYLMSGGSRAFSDYYRVKDSVMVMEAGLRERVTFANHNIVADEIFSEVHLVMCRNVFLCFGPELRRRATRLFHGSLVRGGYLCLGHGEDVGSSGSDWFAVHNATSSTYKKRSDVSDS
jgi:chemotaxis protein methyltransferase CheR